MKLIDADELIKEIEIRMKTKTVFNGVSELMAMSRYIAQLSPFSGWIPFTVEYDEERQEEILQGKLPEEDEDILVTDGKTVWEDTFIHDGEECWLDSNIDLVDTAIAWMPLPEPYKPEN